MRGHICIWASYHCGSNRKYAALILEHTNSDERAALELFWVLLDEYRGLEEALDGPVLPLEQ